MAQNKTKQHFRQLDVDKEILSVINNGVIILNDQLQIHYYNKWMQLHTKFKENDVLGKKLYEIFPTINKKTLKRKIQTAFTIQTPTFYTASSSHYLIPIKINQIKNSLFKYMQQDVSIIPFKQDKQFVAVIITDQTIMANTNALLQTNIQKVKELNEALIKEKEITEFQHKQLLSNSRSAAMGEMISMIAHQWRQPLSLINTVIATLKIKKELGILDNKIIDNSINKIEKTTNFLSSTIDDFRDYFKPNKIAAKVNISNLFEKSLFFLKSELKQLDIEYDINIDPDISIVTYKNELLQTILNILKNSIDAFKENNIKNKKISVIVVNNKESVLITIEDNAGGIRIDNLQKVFEPYFSTKSKNGTGLGLYMCKTIINEHLHGNISLNSNTNGTKVAIQLPNKV
ncbi:PAS domain-containing sensor histidine kinase [Sulfurimonas autotrophica]|uniref:histidine kinase n=1 Tax=Sulfurimonas autotrophica (strain ATCC BAA-671 / DSM 16294 / JCM 11897 / OK10) TaxID=563040 RepID=E0USB1_SULAO|nr:PAS domain-containing sensor histidine kinase [Sulfurimonas autotrophica]ADN10204.1 PAS/PAC sensor signal transduction histidine kinase [Sulfurimonas autotrophica DSM 16294]